MRVVGRKGTERKFGIETDNVIPRKNLDLRRLRLRPHLLTFAALPKRNQQQYNPGTRYCAQRLDYLIKFGLGEQSNGLLPGR